MNLERKSQPVYRAAVTKLKIPGIRQDYFDNKPYSSTKAIELNTDHSKIATFWGLMEKKKTYGYMLKRC